MSNRYLEKVAGFPGQLMQMARKSFSEVASRPVVTSANSGLRTSSTVGGSAKMSPVRQLNVEGSRMLNKIAEMVMNDDKTLPYRRRVEVAIQKGNKVLLTKNKDKKTGNTWYGFPGGGTEGDTDAVASEKECMEEVGIKIKDLVKTDVFAIQEGISDKAGRGEKYRGSKTRYLRAIFDKYDDSKLGDDGDAAKYVWKTKDEALTLLGDDPLNKYRVKVIKGYFSS